MNMIPVDEEIRTRLDRIVKTVEDLGGVVDKVAGTVNQVSATVNQLSTRFAEGQQRLDRLIEMLAKEHQNGKSH